MPSSTRKWLVGKKNVARRHSQWGLEAERQLEVLLQRLKDGSEILDFTHHQRNSEEDAGGKDFTAWRLVNGQVIKRSFGISFS